MLALWAVLGPEAPAYLAAMACIALASVLAYGTPLAVQLAIDAFASGTQDRSPPAAAVRAWLGGDAVVTEPWRIAAFAAATALLAGALTWGKGVLAARASQRAVRRLRERVHSHLTRLPLSFFDRHSSGDLVQRCTSDVDTVLTVLSGQVTEIGRATALLLAAVPLMLLTDVSLALWSLLCGTALGAFGALSAFYHDSTDIADPEHRKISSHRLIAKMPTIAAMAYKYSVSQPFLYPDNKLSYTGNFLRMTFGVPAEEYEVIPAVEKAMDRIFILHADHEQNASTSTVRLAGSSGANPFACIAAGIACLWGPAHGGANEAALNMLKEIGTPDKIPHYIERAKDKNDPFRLMGFGHRVYKNYDPRATVMQKTVREVFDALKVNDPLFETALRLEEIALSDPYFVEKKLFPNVDFYSGIILSAIGFPTTMFTALFALARTVGWVAQWNEMISDPGQKIGRPRQLYTGPTQRDYVPLNKR